VYKPVRIYRKADGRIDKIHFTVDAGEATYRVFVPSKYFEEAAQLELNEFVRVAVFSERMAMYMPGL
jgi:hypothetical protein